MMVVIYRKTWPITFCTVCILFELATKCNCGSSSSSSSSSSNSSSHCNLLASILRYFYTSILLYFYTSIQNKKS